MKTRIRVIGAITLIITSAYIDQLNMLQRYKIQIKLRNYQERNVIYDIAQFIRIHRIIQIIGFEQHIHSLTGIWGWIVWNVGINGIILF